MSVRAYRVNKPATLAKDSTLNVWRHTELVDFLSGDGAWTSESSGELRAFEVNLDRLEEAVIGLKDGSIEIEGEGEAEGLIESLEKDIKWAKKNKQEYIHYECF